MPVPHTRYLAQSSWLGGKPLIHSQTQNEHEKESEINPQYAVYANLSQGHQDPLRK